MCSRATKYLPELKDLDYLDRLAKLYLPIPWPIEQLGGEMIEIPVYKIAHNVYDSIVIYSDICRHRSNIMCPAQEAILIKYSRSNASYLNENIASRIEL